jgi:predicted nuclease of predicted toxin-antitoxin system
VRFLADECVWRSVVVAIRSRGHEIEWVHEVSPSIEDEAVLALSGAHEAILLTEDGDFGELLFRRRLRAFAVVRVRLSRYEGQRTGIAAAVAARIDELGEALIGQFTTIDAQGIRQRVLPSVTDRA